AFALESLGDLRPHGDRGRHLLRVAAPHTQTLEPVVDLVGRHPPRKRLEAEAPGGDAEAELAVQGSEPVEELDSPLVGGEMRVDGAVDAELGEPANRRSRVLLL